MDSVSNNPRPFLERRFFLRGEGVLEHPKNVKIRNLSQKWNQHLWNPNIPCEMTIFANWTHFGGGFGGFLKKKLSKSKTDPKNGFIISFFFKLDITKIENDIGNNICSIFWKENLFFPHFKNILKFQLTTTGERIAK